MKNIAITCFVLIAVCVGLQAKKVVKAPYFMAANTSQIEFRKSDIGKGYDMDRCIKYILFRAKM